MSGRIAVVGARGRVGSALVAHLGATSSVRPVDRQPGESAADLAARAADDADVIVNAAGVAHVVDETPGEIERLRSGNVELPLALAGAALGTGAHLVHISSVKSMPDALTAYGRSKYEGDRALERDFAEQFANGGLGLVVVRPLALLFPPFAAGRLRRLRALRFVPGALVPRRRVPALTTSTFLATIDALVADAVRDDPPVGFRWHDFARQDQCTLRDVQRAMRDEARGWRG